MGFISRILGRLIHRTRVELGLSTQDLARASGVGLSVVVRVESGDPQVDIGSYARVWDVLSKSKAALTENLIRDMVQDAYLNRVKTSDKHQKAVLDLIKG